MSVPITHTAFLGLGSNLEDPMGQVRAAFRAIRTLPGVVRAQCSSLYASAPVGYADQPDFINAVVKIDTTLAPQDLLDALLKLERAAGRVRDQPNGPRTLDIDVLLYGTLTLHTATLCVPHPRMHERGFVLLPLLELAPHVEIPGRGAAKGYVQGLGVLGDPGGQGVTRVGDAPL